MASEGRRLLPPQSSEMASFSFAPPVYPQTRETQRNYVFVDEHNRHKRVKVMRACEGCRRRKIKCDAATTNTWPCSACIRLKLTCLRPNSFDGASEPQVYEPPQPQFERMQQGFGQQLPLHDDQQLLAGVQRSPSIYQPQTTYADTAGLYFTESPVPPNMHYTTMASTASVVHQAYPAAFSSPPPLQHRMARQESPPEDYAQDLESLADVLGSLKVDEAGTAPYLNNKWRGRAPVEEPAVEDADDYKSMLPPLSSGPGLKIRIPPELMPDDETVMHYFDVYFANAHAYVPVLDKTSFYQLWQTDRGSISPLLLEAIFAVSGRVADDPAQGQQWLAMATRHADSFMDVPRLSTLQALLIILKAREQAPKRGYYYRSWMSIVQCVQMGKDLGLDEHYADHKAGRPCECSLAECLLKTRIWQSVFVIEVMIGSSQARTDLQVDIDSVDFSVPSPNSDETEYHVSRNFTYLARVVRNIARMNRAYARLRRNKEWGIDPEFVQIEPEVKAWLHDLPSDLKINYPTDGSAPWIPSLFIGNMHSYYYLSIILFHRPQLASLNPNGADGQWKHHMLVSYNAAKMLCRLQEAVVQSFHLPGLQCMQRGINFTIYAVLSSIVLHLVALTSPDPELNNDAREYFTRHMRILETCMAAWPMEDMQRQVDSVREAFSADTSKPFVLKADFRYGSPLQGSGPPPQSRTHQKQHQQQAAYLSSERTASMASSMSSSIDHHHHHHHVDPCAVTPYTSQPISPPVSTGSVDLEDSPVGMHSGLAMLAASSQPGQTAAMAQTVPLHGGGGPGWNPNRIFNQWNTTFGTQCVLDFQRGLPPLAYTSYSSSSTTPNASGPGNVASLGSGSLSVHPSSTAADVSAMQDMSTVHHNHAQLPMPFSAPSQAPAFVTPTMWQESVASAYEGGLKRAWDYDDSMAGKRVG